MAERKRWMYYAKRRMRSTIRENPFLRFLLLSSMAYLIWYAFYDFYLKPFTKFDEVVIHSLTHASGIELRALGFELNEYSDGAFSNHVGIAGSSGVTVGSSCDGIVLLALFTIFILAFPGPLKHKLWFIPLGIFAIWLINSFRITALACISKLNEKWFGFNHDYTFTILV